MSKSYTSVMSKALALSNEYGTYSGQAPGATGPRQKTQSLPDYRIYYAPEMKQTREREEEAAENRQKTTREKFRGFWGPPPTDEERLRSPADVNQYVDHGPRLGVERATLMGPKISVDRVQSAQKPYEKNTGRKRKTSRKLRVRRK